ncbi:MAG: S-layer homology domain-containing protein, partial [Acidimicrobiaceae bacterium]|nr:S-layer homology domain-containing protein [Acidimicrobiaceae bacterium]
MRRRRSGWGVLAVGALLASGLAAGAVPAAAVTDSADHATRLSACVAAAAEDRKFSDVSEGHAHRAAINCIAYYQITQGTGDGSTYSPNQDVTRAQMAVFVARAATAAGVALGSGSGGFNDIGRTWAEARDAINGLAARGMIPSGGAFRPDDTITRAEMATFLIGLLAKASPNVTIDSAGVILLGAPGSRAEADDHFADARASVHAANDAEISALYELGVTRGASPAAVRDGTEPPLDFNYEPEVTVDRGQMAEFITRALSHTTVRPAGVTT